MPQTVAVAAVAADPGLQQQQLRQRLAAVRRRLRFVTTFRGACWLLVILLGGAAVAGLLDWRLHLPGVILALLLVATLAAAGVVFYRRLYLPLRVKDDDLTLALRIEQLYPGLNDSFASAVQFLDTEDAHNSPVLRREAVSRGLGRVQVRLQPAGQHARPVAPRRPRPAARPDLPGARAVAARRRRRLAGALPRPVRRPRLAEEDGASRWTSRTCARASGTTSPSSRRPALRRHPGERDRPLQAGRRHPDGTRPRGQERGRGQVGHVPDAPRSGQGPARHLLLPGAGRRRRLAG